MNDRELKKKAASGFVYRFAERALAKGISFVVQLLLARLLMPEEYGVASVGSSESPAKIRNRNATRVCASEETSLSTRENSVPIIPGIYFPARYVS